MPDLPPNPAPPTGVMPDVRSVIRRGKRRDKVFSWTGAGLIVLSLGVLGLLIGKLVYDGGGHVFHSQEVKLDGHSPRLNELVGKLEKQPAPGPDGKPVYVLRPDAYPLDPARFHIGMETAQNVKMTPQQVPQKLAELAGRKAVIAGTIYDAAGGPFTIEHAAVVEGEKAGAGAAIPRGTLVGAIKQTKAGADPEFAVQFEPLALDLTDLEPGVNIDGLAGKRVAVNPKRIGARKAGELKVTDATELVSKPFVMSMPASQWYRAGILSAAVGTLLIMLVTMLTTLPLGVAAGVYLEEYAPKNRFTAIVEVNIANLAGVPSIIWGLLGLGLFVYGLRTGRSIAAAGMTLGLLVLPIVIIATREAIRAIPGTIRDASMALGATKWQTVRHHVLPYSMGGILTGTIVALSRAIGETAPLIVVGAAVLLTYLPQPDWPYEPSYNPAVAAADPSVPKAAAGPAEAKPAADAKDAAAGRPVAPPASAPADPAAGDREFAPLAWRKAQFTALPIQMFNWTSRPEREFHKTAAAAGIILIAMTLSLNSVAIYMRGRLRKKIKW